MGQDRPEARPAKDRRGFMVNAMIRLLRFMSPGVVWDEDQGFLMADGLLGNMAGTFVNPFMTAFALGFGASKFHISMLNAIPGLFGNLAQLPGSYIVETTGRRRRLVMVSAVLTRVVWVLVILLPFYARSLNAVYLLIGLMTIISALGAVLTPAWTSLVSDWVPRSVRGRFFAARNMLMSAGALLTVNLAGRIVTLGGFPKGYVRSMSVFLALSLLSLYYFSKIRDVPFAPSRTSHRLGIRLDMDALKSPGFSTWIWILSVFNLFTGLVGSLFGAYLIQDLHGTPAHLAYMSFASTLTTIIGQRFWGPLSDRRGHKFGVVVSACLSGGVPLIWYLAKGPWGGILAETYAGAAWSAWGLCSFNLILDLTPESRRPSYVATGNAMAGITGFVAPLIGGYLATKYSLRPLMLVSAVGRFGSGLLFSRFIREPRETREAQMFT